MSSNDKLKNLVKKAHTSNAGGALGAQNISFSSIEYNLHHRAKDNENLALILANMLKLLQDNKPILDKDKKNFILTFFRLAFSQESRAKGCFHPSEISTEDNLCNRKLYFQKADIRVDATYVNFTADNRMMRLVDLGTMVHLYVQENLDRAGVLEDFEVPVSFPEYGIEGKMDGIVTYSGLDDLGKFYHPERMVLEVKTINDYGFKSLRKAKPEHIKQASIYGHLLGLKRICFLYYNKNTSEHKIFIHDVAGDYVDDFKFLAKSIILWYNNNIRQTRTTDISYHVLPKRTVCHTRTGKRAMECPFADTCFKLKN